MSLILGYITTREIEMLERTGKATITEKPAEEGVVSFALVFERELAVCKAAADFFPGQLATAESSRTCARISDALTTVAPIDRAAYIDAIYAKVPA